MTYKQGPSVPVLSKKDCMMSVRVLPVSHKCLSQMCQADEIHSQKGDWKVRLTSFDGVI